jgi:hypothetical protein
LLVITLLAIACAQVVAPVSKKAPSALRISKVLLLVET